MVDIRTGCIDAWRLGCPMGTLEVWAMHIDGRTVPEIASAMGVREHDVRSAITSVWLEDRLAASRARKFDGR